VPLAGFTAAEGKSQSPFLLAAFRLEEVLGSPGSGSLAVAAAAGIFGIAVILLSARPALGTSVVLGAALVASVAASVGAVAFDSRNAASVRAAFLPDDPSWVDRAGLDDVTLVRGPDGVRTEALEQLFWNRSVNRVVLLPGAAEVDHFHSAALSVGSEGSLSSAGRRLRGPVLVDGYGGTILLADAERIASSQSYTLWRPNGTARMSLYLAGRFSDGWLSAIGRMYLWPERDGGTIARRVSLTLTAPAGADDMTIRFQGPDGKAPRHVRLAPGQPRTVTFEVCSRGPWHMTYSSNVRGFIGSRVVSAQASEPRVAAMSCSPDPVLAPAMLKVEAA
jgi:hypothetical protein